MVNFTLKHTSPIRRYVPKNIKHEESLQRTVCHYLRLRFPQVTFRSDYASGLHLTPSQARIHASLQSGRAWPDLFIYSAKRGYHGLALELKKEGTAIIIDKGPRKGHIVANEHVREQVLMCKELRRQGYFATITCGYKETIDTIEWYFGIPKIERQTLF